MIRRLRFRLVWVSMFSLLLVLTLIVGGLNLLIYLRVVQDADGVLALLKENGGTFPAMDESAPQRQWDDLGYRSRELPYEARFFFVRLDGTGGLVSEELNHIAAVDGDAALGYARTVQRRGREKGFVGIYRYFSWTEADETRVLFLDCGRMLSVSRNIRLRSALLCGAMLLTVFLLIMLLSGRIVKPISDSYEKQKRFITDAGHEIKTPITIIDADTEILEMDIGENEWLTEIRQQSRRLAEVTNSLIYLSRLEEQEELTMIEFPLSDVVNETAAAFQGLARTRGLTLEIDVQPMLSLRGSEKGIRQLVSILLDNALKYSSEGGGVRLAMKRQGKGIQLTVENDADGVSRETLENMFERFYRGDPSRNSATRGYGIGLSVARAVVQAHKGKIAAASPDGRSVTLTVTLPAPQAKGTGEDRA